jgi:cell division protease FtsH
MSDLGPLAYGERDDLIFLGRDLAMNKNFSERTAEHIDEEVKKIIGRNFERAQQILDANKPKLKKIAKLLLEKEIISSDDINVIVKGRRAKPAKPAPDGTPFQAAHAAHGAHAADAPTAPAAPAAAPAKEPEPAKA